MTKAERRALMVGLLLALFVVDWTISNPGPCVPSEQQQSNQRPKERCSLAKTFTVRGFDAAVDWIDRRHDFVTAAATVVIALFTITLWRATRGLLEAAKVDAAISKQSAAAAETSADVSKETLVASQRAWIRRTKIRPGNALKFWDDGGASGGVAFEFTNIGNAPALHVTMHAKLFAITDGIVPHTKAQQFFKEVREGPLDYGFTLFPGEDFPKSIGFGGIVQDITLSKEEVARASAGTGRYMGLYVAACIDYTFPSDSGHHHQTSFLLELQKIDGAPISANDGLIVMELLSLRDTGFGGMDHAD